MAVTATRTITVVFSGSGSLTDVVGTEPFSAANNTTSIAKMDLVSLASGNNTITVPSVTGFSVVAVTIVPPPGNTNLVTLKGVNGDTGFGIHKTDPTCLALDTSTSSFVLSAANTINGVRLIWN